MKYSTLRDEIIGNFWGKKGETFKGEFEGIEEAIFAAVGDLTERTLKKKDKVKDYPQKVAEKVKKLKEKGFYDKVKELFEGEQPKEDGDFDKWHKAACVIVNDAFENYYTNWKYGKAQKVVNMTLKYVYCLDWAKDCREHFKYCHIPLDSYTLEWIVRNVFDKNLKDGRTDKNGKELNAIKGLVDSWSNLEYDKPNKEGKYPYIYFVKWIRGYFNSTKASNYDGLYPLEAEFYIWKEIQLHMALESILSYFDEDKAKQGDLIDKCKSVNQLLSDKIKELSNNP